jgi:hypothetical protein
MKGITIVLFLVLIIGCNTNNEQEVNSSVLEETSFFSIDFPYLLKNKQTVPVSNIANKIEYLPLETTPNCLTGSVLEAKFSKNFIFIQHNGIPLLSQFDWNGNFIRNIGTVGRGPKEYALMRSFSIDENNNLVYIFTNYTKKILVFTFEGEFVNSINLKGRDESLGMEWSRDSVFVFFNPQQMGNEKFAFLEKTLQGDTIQGILHSSFWESKNAFPRSNSYWGRNTFYRFNKQLHFKEWYNDTIYSYNAQNKIKPIFFIDLKHHKLPDDCRIEVDASRGFSETCYWTGVRETTRFIFIQYGTYSLRNYDGGYLYYDKNTRLGYSVNNEKERLGFVNDFDGGPDFIPEYTNDSLAFYFISAVNFKSHMSSDYFKIQSAKNPELKERLRILSEGINENDNHILMIAKLR